ncbi:MAG: hypothetical protein ACLGH0_10745, partial [Thermoanaerobaculia bacterium]
KTMTTKKPPQRPPDENTAVDLNRQYDQMFASLKKYVDQRLEAHAALRTNAPQPSAVTNDWWKYAAAAVAGIVLTLAVLVLTGVVDFSRKPAAPEPQVVDLERDAPEPEPTPITPQPRKPSPTLRKLIADASTSNQWATAFRDLTVAEPETVAALIDKAIRHETTGAASRQKLAALQTRVRGEGAKLESTDREDLRDYLLQYIATQVGSDVIIDDKLNDLSPAVIKRLKDATNAASTETQPTNNELQGELILRWLEKNPS